MLNRCNILVVIVGLYLHGSHQGVYKHRKIPAIMIWIYNFRVNI